MNSGNHLSRLPANCEAAYQGERTTSSTRDATRVRASTNSFLYDFTGPPRSPCRSIRSTHRRCPFAKSPVARGSIRPPRTSCSTNSARALRRRKDGGEMTGTKGRRKRSEQLCKGNAIHFAMHALPSPTRTAALRNVRTRSRTGGYYRGTPSLLSRLPSHQ